MASGSEDYWTTSGRLLAGLIEAIKTSILSGGDLINAIEGIELGDGFLTLEELNSEQCLMLGKLTGIDTSLLTDGDLLNALDALDGTMDGRLTLDELNASSVKTNLDTVITKLTATVAELVDAVAELVGVHSDTTAMIDFATNDWSGGVGTGWTLISSIHQTRNMLEVTNTGNTVCDISRDGINWSGDSIEISSSATFYDAPGVWLKVSAGSSTFSAHEEWAT